MSHIQLSPIIVPQEDIDKGFEYFIDHVKHEHEMIGAMVVQQQNTPITIGRGHLKREVSWKQQDKKSICQGFYELNSVDPGDSCTVEEWLKKEK